MEVFRNLWEYYWPYRWYSFSALAALILTTGLTMVYPFLLKILINTIFIGHQYQDALGLALIVVGTSALKGLFNFTQQWLGQLFGQHSVFDMRNDLYRKLQYLSFTYYDNAKTGDLMSRLTADVEAFRQFLSFGFAGLVNFFLTVTVGVILMLSIDWKLTIVSIITIPILGFTAMRFDKRIHPAFSEIRKTLAGLTTAVQENVTGVRTVKSFAREAYEVNKFSNQNDNYVDANLTTATLWSRFFPLMEFLGNCSVVLLLAYGGALVVLKQMSLGDLVAFLSLIWYVIGPVSQLGYQINNLTQARAAGERLLEVLYTSNDIVNPTNIQSSLQTGGHVQFHDVSFTYPGAGPALYNIDMDVPIGNTVGILGETGAGKTSLVMLLSRFYDVTSGRITMDGVNIKDMSLEAFRREIGVVFQETFLFSSSIRSNIAYGCSDVSDEDIIVAAKLAEAHNFIMELPKGYDTIVGERGMGLSGGQKQRLAIARAIIMNPKVLVLDDATSAVDMETEYEIQTALRNVMQGRTTFIVAHRISSVKGANEIIVLERGRVVERGDHNSLLALNGHYRHIYEIQYNQEDKPMGMQQTVRGAVAVEGK